MQELKTARETIADSTVELWYDKLFVKHLVKKIQDLDVNIGAVIYPELKTIVFLWNKIIIHKAILDEHNTEDTTLDTHVKQAQTKLSLLKSGFIPRADMNMIRKEASRLNIKRGKLL